MANYDDKTMMTDMLASQKFIAQNYNNYAGECSTKQSKAKLMKILGEEHDIQFKIFEQMNAKGWYPTTPAAQDKINEAVQQVAMFEAMYQEYAQNPNITRSRMYYEAISEILPGVKLYINTGDGSNVDMLLPLESLVGGN